MRGNRKFLIAFLVVLAVAIYAEVTAPQPVDWSESYSRYHRKPYGTYVLYELLAEGFGDADVRTSDEPIYNTLDREYAGASYVFINREFRPDDLDRDALLSYVERGNSAFIAACELDGTLADSLGVEIDERWLAGADALEQFLLRDTVAMNFSNPSIRAARGYPIRVGRGGIHWLRTFDSSTTTVLGRDGEDRADFVKIVRADGAIYLSTVPTAFTNINALTGRNADYAFAALSYLPRRDVLWDEYYKSGRTANSSPLRFVLQQTALRWIYILALVGVALFFFVYGRRRQRAIPIVEPPKNTTLEFTETVGRLYYEHGDHRGIARKKVQYFYEYLRSHLGLSVDDFDASLYRRVAERSGVPEELVRTIFGRIELMPRANEFDEHDLKGLNGDLEEFYSNSKR
jgi:hypothetical protein